MVRFTFWRIWLSVLSLRGEISGINMPTRFEQTDWSSANRQATELRR
jgi:hypothetical protein